MAATFANWIARIPTWGLWLAAAIYWCALMFALHYPDIPGAQNPPPGADKLVHCLLYGVLAVLWRLLIGRQTTASGVLSTAWRRSLLTFGLVIVQAVADEWTQPLTGRHNDVWDLIFDVAGAACFLAAYHFLIVRHADASADPTPAHGY
ncbi:MAG TPA: VanZ family protein [Pirellulales bacterium]|jgi:VanZ family protein|nr:VanZ family protein [Pirellulales bacterium]